MNEILLQKLNEYEKIFTLASYEKHIVIILTIKNFVQRFQKFPELKCRANLMVSSDEVFFLTVGLCLMFFRDDFNHLKFDISSSNQLTLNATYILMQLAVIKRQ